MSHREVCRAFAAGREGDGGNLRSERASGGVVLVSYSTPVALLRDGAPTALFTARTFSVTTAKQMTRAQQACAAAGLSVEALTEDAFHAAAKRLGADLSAAR